MKVENTMQFISTRNNYKKVDFATAVVQGMVPVGGLFVPETFPHFDVETMLGKPYQAIAEMIFSAFYSDFSKETISDMVEKAYTRPFTSTQVVPLKKVDTDYVLELFHGPTAAFKDVALQLLPHTMVNAYHKLGMQNEIVVLVATSGDTGKAALEGFLDVPHTHVICFYPKNGVSEMQALQMNTTKGKNTHVVGVDGNFDDCQNAVKELFGDDCFKQSMEEKGIVFSSAKSINIGRLLPQIVYYFSSYAQLVKEHAISLGDSVNFCVPTGNFGNILAGYYAKKMGLPVHKFLCASNKNNVLTDFFQSGTYVKNRAFYKTTSPSMDILISSNLERYLFDKVDGNGETIATFMQELAKDGTFTIDEGTKALIDEELYAGCASDEEVAQTISDVYQQTGYVLDPHTAVGYAVTQNYKKKTHDDHLMIIAGTASPLKFSKTVANAITQKEESERNGQEFLEHVVNLHHEGLCAVKKEPIRHTATCAVAEIRETIQGICSTLYKG